MENNLKSNKKQLLFNIITGALAGVLVFVSLTVFFTKTYGLTLQEYKDISAFKEFTQKYYYENTDNVDFKTGIRKGIIDSLNDPYSKYLTKEEFDKTMEDTTGEFVGIGVYIAPTENNTIAVVSPIKGSPAEKVGIKSGDIIESINGKKYDAKHMEDAVKQMRGKAGEKVVIGILDKNGKRKEYTLIKSPIHPQTVGSKVIDNNIGYIQIISFEGKTAEEFRKNYEDLKKKNVKGLIIDLRSNPGGLVDQVIDIADQILPRASIVYTNNKNDEKEYFNSDEKESITLPIVVLVNEGSASASEILSGALQDNKAATIVGQQTYGKGVIQSVLQMGDDGGLILTTAQYFTPNGHIVHGKGITPDVKVESSQNTKNKDVQLEKAIEVMKGKIK